MTKRKGNKMRVMIVEGQAQGYYAECHRTHEHLGGKVDGCQEYEDNNSNDMCKTCGCLEKFHRWVAPIEEYTKCHKVHDLKIPNSIDGCQHFMPASKYSDYCGPCGCHKAFHSSETTK